MIPYFFTSCFPILSFSFFSFFISLLLSFSDILEQNNKKKEEKMQYIHKCSSSFAVNKRKSFGKIGHSSDGHWDQTSLSFFQLLSQFFSFLSLSLSFSPDGKSIQNSLHRTLKVLSEKGESNGEVTLINGAKHFLLESWGRDFSPFLSLSIFSHIHTLSSHTLTHTLSLSSHSLIHTLFLILILWLTEYEMTQEKDRKVSWWTKWERKERKREENDEKKFLWEFSREESLRGFKVLKPF